LSLQNQFLLTNSIVMLQSHDFSNLKSISNTFTNILNNFEFRLSFA